MTDRKPVIRTADVSSADPLPIDAFLIYIYANAAPVEVTLTLARNLLDAHARCSASPPDERQTVRLRACLRAWATRRSAGGRARWSTGR